MKRILSIVLCFCILLSSFCCIAYANEFNNDSLKETISNVSNLLKHQTDDFKTIEDAASCRVIVKASQKPINYGNFDLIECIDDVYIYQYSNSEIVQKALEFYENQDCVEWAELDGVVSGNANTIPAGHLLQTSEIKTIVDENNKNLEPVIVAVLDSGINFDAPAFDGRIVYDTGVNLSDSGSEGTAQGDNIHGTNVSCLIIENTNSNVLIYGYKILNKHLQATNSALALGIKKAIEDKVDIINISMSSRTYSNYLYEQIKEAQKQGIIVVCSSGNSNDDTSNYYPASFDEVFTVGSIDKNGNKSFFSNYGKEVDFVALGQDILLYGDRMSGTSFSCPLVSSIVAWVLSYAPTLTPDEVNQCLIDSCVPYERLAYHDGFHPISDYDIDYDGLNGLESVKTEVGTKEEYLYYGYGMPQIIPAVASALDKKTSIDAPNFSLTSGTYNEEIVVSLTSNEGYDIYYTTDESFPTREYGTKYTEPIVISGSMSIRAVAYDENNLRSNPLACEYKIEYFAQEKDFVIDVNGTIKSYNGNLKEFVIPQTINGVVVKGIGRNAFSRKQIRSIKLPETVVSIGNNSFNMSKLEFLDAVGCENIGDYAFAGCPLIYINTPNLKTIGESAFSNSKIRTLYLPELTNIGCYSFYENTFLNYVEMPQIQTIPSNSFYGCVQLRSAVFDSVKIVDVNSFAGCHFLKEIYIPNITEFICTEDENIYGTFYNCINLTEIDFLHATSLYGRCFSDCWSLEKVNLPNVIAVDELTFKQCSKLKNITLEKVEYIGNQAFYGTNLSGKVYFPSVKEIANEVFCNTALIGLSLPSLETLGENSFANINEFSTEYYCIDDQFSFFEAPNLIIAKDNAFAYTKALKFLDLPQLVEIGENAFYESGVSRIEFSNIERAKSLPVIENSIIALPSTFNECTEDTKGRNYQVYGTSGTYAEEWAKENGHTFINISQDTAILNDVPMEYTGNGEILSLDAIGFNRTYQWYGSYDNKIGDDIAILSATKNTFTPDEDNEFPYYYCKMISTDINCDGEIVSSFEVYSSLCENKLYNDEYEGTILSPMTSQIRFSRNDDGSYANMFDVRTRAKITDEDFKTYIAETNEDAVTKISKVGFVYSRGSNSFSTEDAKKVARGETVNGYTDAPVSYIQDADGYYMFTCLVVDIPVKDVKENLTAFAYICVDDKWYFFDAEVTADFNSLHSTYYPQAAEKYSWEVQLPYLVNK